MSAQEQVKTLQFNIDSKFAFNFDEIQNIVISNRKSDVGFSEDEKLMIRMRPWTSKIWNTHNTAWWVSNQFFFTDFFRTRWHIKWYDNKVWRLIWGTWTDLALSYTWNEFKFNTVKLPMMTDGTLPTEHTTNATSPWAEQIDIAPTDSDPSPIWKYLIITDDPNWNQSFRWTFASILSTDWSTYTLNWAWVSSAVQSWAKYQIYDTLWEYLQVMNWIEYEKFIFAKSDTTFVVNPKYTWMATNNLRNIKAFSSTEFLSQELAYDASYWVFNKWTLYYSSWIIWNPFFFTFNAALTIPWNNWWDIEKLFVFKERLIIWGNNFMAYINWITNLVEVKLISNSFWIQWDSLVDVWVDWYFVSSNKKIYSLSETITWTLKATNVWKTVWNYVKDFNEKLSSWYDWRKLYFYGQIDTDTTWKIVVLDLEYNFWATFTGLRPSTILLEQWTLYLSDNNSDTIRIFDDSTFQDTGTDIEQKLSWKDIDLWDPFSVKTISDLYLWLDNFTQSLTVDMYMSIATWNARKVQKTITIEEVDVNWVAPEMWETEWWTWLLWGLWAEPLATYPFLKHIQYDADQANIWKIIITWLDWSAFYLNHLDIEIWYNEQTKNYFSSENTI